MNRLWRQLAIASNWPVLVAVLLLSLLGLVSIWATSPTDGPRQLVFLLAAIGCLAAVQGVNYLAVGRYAWGLYVFSLLLVGYTVAGAVVPLPFVHSVNGASCWINFPSFSFEPSELMKVSYVMVMARYLRYRSNYRTLNGLWAPLGLTLAPILLILKQPDLGVAALFLPAMLALLFVAGAKIRHLAAVIGVILVLIPFAWLCGQPGVPILQHFPSPWHSYQRGRVMAMFSDDPRTMRDAGFQQERALEAAGSGGINGKGLGVIPIGQHVPEAHNDMIFAIIGEQFGLVGSIVVLAAYMVLFAAGLEIASATREPFGRLVAVGLVAFLATQAFLNLLVTMRLFPVTGVTLPYVSSGGSSLLASYVAAGLLLNIGQHRPLVVARDSFEFDGE